MVKIAMGARSLILNYNTWTAFDMQGRPWPAGAKLAQTITKSEFIFSQVPDMELAIAERFVQRAGGRIIEQVPDPDAEHYNPRVMY